MNEIDIKSFGSIKVLSQNKSYNGNTGAIVTNGGIGVGKNMYVNNEINANELIVRNSIKIYKNAYITGELNVDSMFVVEDDKILFRKSIIPENSDITLGSDTNRWNLFVDVISANTSSFNTISVDSIDVDSITVNNNANIGTNTSGDPLFVIDTSVPNTVTIDGDLNVKGGFKSITQIEGNEMDDLTVDDLTVTNSIILTGATITGVVDFVKVNGTLPMTGNLNMGTNNITSVGTINGINLGSHSARHLPGATDELPTAAPTTTLTSSTTNQSGSATSFSRSDHVHAIDQSTFDHGSISGLTGDDHPQYMLLDGRTTGQILIGGITAGGNLTLNSTSHATKGSILITETTPSTSTTTGAMIISGGLGVQDAIYAVDMTATNDAFLGEDVSGNPILHVSSSTEQLIITSGVASTDISTGAIVLDGGLGLSGSINIGETATADRYIIREKEVDISSNIYNVTADDPNLLIINPDVEGDVVKLPNATTLPIGWNITITPTYNDISGSKHYDVHDFDGNELYVENADYSNRYMTFTLKDNSTSAGHWMYLAVRSSHIVTVGVCGSDYTSITDALDSIQDATTDERYVIEVGPGKYRMDPFTMKEYVSIIGTSRELSVLIPNIGRRGEPFITAVSNTEIQRVEIEHAEDPGGIGVLCDGTQNFYLIDCEVAKCETLMKITSTSGPGQVRIVLTKFESLYTNGIDIDGRTVAEGGSSTDVNDVTMEVCEIYTDSTVENGIRIRGSNSIFFDRGSQFHTKNGIYGTALSINQGSDVKMTGGIIGEWEYGIKIDNIGDPPTIAICGINIHECTNDILFDHPGLIGTISGSFNRSKISIDSAITGLSIQYLDTENPGSVLPGKVYVGSDNANVFDMVPLIHTLGSGYLMGGAISINGGTPLTIDVEAGNGYVITIASDDHREIVWGNESLLLPANQTNYIYYDEFSVLSYAGSRPDIKYNLVLGRVRTGADEIEFIDQIGFNMVNYVTKQWDYNHELFGTRVASGLVVYADASGNRNISVTGGVYFYSTDRFTPTGGSPISFYEYYNDASGNFTYNPVASTIVDNANYDSGTGLTAVTATKFVKHSLYMLGDGANERYMLVYGQEMFDSQILAEEGNSPIPPTYFDEGVILIAGIVVQEGVNSIISVLDLRPVSVSGGGGGGVGGTSDHGELIGLSNDDHPQYLLVNGSRAMTGGLNMGSNSISNIGTLDGVSITAHMSRHLPNSGTDALTTAAPIANISATTTSIVGSANSLARSDHGHALDLTNSATGIASVQTSQILLNKTITSTTNNVAAKSLLSATTTVDVFAAAAPVAGQALIANSSTSASWQTITSIFGSEYEYSIGGSITNTTATTFTNHISFTTASKPIGTYRICWFYQWAYSNTNNDFLGRIQLDGTSIAEHQQEPSDAAGTPGDTTGITGITGAITNQIYMASGFYIVTFGSATTHTITMQVASSLAGSTASMKDGRIEIMRTS